MLNIILSAYTLFSVILTIFSRAEISIYILPAEESGIQRSWLFQDNKYLLRWTFLRIEEYETKSNLKRIVLLKCQHCKRIKEEKAGKYENIL